MKKWSKTKHQHHRHFSEPSFPEDLTIFLLETKLKERKKERKKY
jgi:hypothetical protein